MTFLHSSNVPVLFDLETIQENGKRFYISPSGKHLPSVTTVLSKLKEESIKEWEEKIGCDEARRLRDKAARRGIEFHALLEDFLNNKPIDTMFMMPDLKEKFLQMKSVLIDNITKIYYNECTLYSELLGTAGRADLIAEWNGVPAVIDFKTSSDERTDDFIESYFLQTTAYSLMLEERTQIKAPILVILMVGDKHSKSQVFIKNRNDYVSRLKEVIDGYTKTLQPE